MKLNEENYVSAAEDVIQRLMKKTDRNGRPIQVVTTSKIRNLLAMTADIYNDVVNSNSEKLSQEVIGRINYLKVRFLYEAGREQGVKNLVEEGNIIEYLGDIKGSRSNYICFSRYMEALVAFRKFYISRDE